MGRGVEGRVGVGRGVDGCVEGVVRGVEERLGV